MIFDVIHWTMEILRTDSATLGARNLTLMSALVTPSVSLCGLVLDVSLLFFHSILLVTVTSLIPCMSSMTTSETCV